MFELIVAVVKMRYPLSSTHYVMQIGFILCLQDTVQF